MNDLLKGMIIKGVGGLYTVDCGGLEYKCSARGLFRLQNITPTVGDRVMVLVTSDAKREGGLYEILPRENELIRPRIANIGLSVITFAWKHPALNYDLLDRLIVLSEKSCLPVIICLNKTDLADGDEYIYFKETYSKAGYPVFPVSASEALGIAELKQAMESKLSVFSGPSGVGKSSVINALLPGKNLETGVLSRKIERGKHTTRHTELIPLGGSGFVADTPGFSSLSLEGIKSHDLAYYYPEMRDTAKKCFFNNCLHITEPDCAVKAEVGLSIDTGRYERYKKIIEEILSNNQ